jgi:hypothetical protein
MGLSVEVLPDAGAPQVGVTVTGLPSGSSSVVTVERTTDGRSWEPVRGAVSESVTGAAFFRDFVAPLNVETTYRLVTTATVTGATSASITVPSDSAWLQDPLSPRTAVAVACVRGADGLLLLSPSAGDIVREMPADVVQVQGARLPVASLGVRQAPAGVRLHLRALAAAQGALVAALSELVESAGTIVVRGLPADIPLDPVAHVIAPEVTDSPVVGGLLGPRRDWVMSVTQVRAPSPRIAVPWWTYDQVKALWDGFTYDDVIAARPGETYLDWLRDPTPLASSSTARATEGS